MTVGCDKVKHGVNAGIGNGLSESWVSFSGHVLLELFVNILHDRGDTSSKQRWKDTRKIRE